MAIQFPDAPAQGDTHVSDNGVVYTFENGGWTANPQNITNLNGGPLAGFRNKLINGNFEINQRGSVFTLADNPSAQNNYTLDRWLASYVGIIATVAQDIQTPGVTDSRYGMRVTISNGGGGVNNYLALIQRIEDCSTLAGKPFTLSFTAKANTAVSMGVEFTRSYGAGGSSSDMAVVTEKVDLTTSFTKYTITGTMPSVSGKTFGSDTGDLSVFFWMTAGTDWNDRASSIGLQTGTIDIMDVQLEEGPVATPFEQRPIGTELALCQRYYYKGNDRCYMQQLFSPGAGLPKYGGTFGIPVSLRNTGTYDQSASTIVNISTAGGATHPFLARVATSSISFTGQQLVDSDSYIEGFAIDAEI